MKSTELVYFTVKPLIAGQGIKLSWKYQNVSADEYGYTYDYDGYDSYGYGYPGDIIWSGRVACIKRQHGFPRRPDDNESVLLFDITVDPTSVEEQYFIDEGFNYDGSIGGALPVDLGVDWPYDPGYGLAGGINYYYVLILYDINGDIQVSPAINFQSAYSYSNWDHHQWYLDNLPSHYIRYDNGTIDSMTNIIGTFFDSLKTDCDQLEYLYDIEKSDESLLELIEGTFNWPSDYNLDPKVRREEIKKVSAYINKKGRIDTLKDIISFAYNIDPYIRLGWKHTIFANSANSPYFKPAAVSNNLYDFVGDYDWGYGYGYWSYTYDTDYGYAWLEESQNPGFGSLPFGGGPFGGTGLDGGIYGPYYVYKELGELSVTCIQLPAGVTYTQNDTSVFRAGDIPTDNDFFKGMRLETDDGQWADIALYIASSRLLVLDRQLTLTTDNFVKIYLGVPALTGWLAQDFNNNYFNVEQSIMRTNGYAEPFGVNSLVFKYRASSIEENLTLKNTLDKLQKLNTSFIPDFNDVRLVIRFFGESQDTNVSLDEWDSENISSLVQFPYYFK